MGNPSGVIGENCYNRRILEIIKEYDNKDVLNQPHFVNMLGGTRLKQFIDSGDTSYDNEAVFGGAKPFRKTKIAKVLKKVVNVLKPKVLALKKAHKRFVKEIDGEDGRIAQNFEPGMQVPEVYEDYGLPPLPMKAGRNYNQKKKGIAKFARNLGNFVKPLARTLKPVSQALVAKAVEKIQGAGAGGRAYNQKKKGVFKLLRNIGNYVKPLARTLKPVSNALVSKAVEKIQGAGKPRSARGALVSKVMKEQGLGLGAASKYVKENGLY